MSKRIRTLVLLCLLSLTGTQQAQEVGPRNGTLLLAGGGKLGKSIYRRFSDLAGGENARLVVIPTAGTASRYDHSWPGLRIFNDLPHASVRLLHTRDRAIADSDAFVEPLREATGVWFTGGRQWRLADAYLNTRTHRELQALLDRGGIIGGSSAGATIQGSYLARGDTKTNQIMMGDHEVGLGFLRNVAVDQHLLKQNRQFDLIPVIRKHPYLLGIGIDEGTAIVVQKDTFEVIGESYVALYERAHINNPSRPFRLLSAGQKHEMEPPNEPLSEILFGSCIQESQATPIFNTLLKHRPHPDLFLFLGDNIYADTKDPDIMREKYATLRANPQFDQLTRSLPILATWDDHDFGWNDAGSDYVLRDTAEQIFLDFWNIPASSPQRHRPGIFTAHSYGPPGKRVQVILLDTRFFRSALEKGERRVGGPYVPSTAPDKTMLGEAQWRWLESQLRKPANVRIVVSSIQLVADDAGQECWANFPRERTRFFDLIATTQAHGVIIVSGDRHWSELSQESEIAPYPIFDLTSSSLNQTHPRGTPTENKHRFLPSTFHKANYGRIAIDWTDDVPALKLEIRDLSGTPRLAHSISLADLQPK